MSLMPAKRYHGLARLHGLVQAELRGIDARWHPSLVVATAAVVLLLPKYADVVQWFPALLKAAGGAGFARACASMHCDPTFFLQGIFPLLLILIMREPLAGYGLGFGNVRLGLKMCALFYLLYVPCFAVLLLNAGFQKYYAGVAHAYPTWFAFFAAQVPALIFLAFRTEFLFRGFILFGIKKDYGPYAGMLVQLIPYVMVHAGKAPLEAIGSLPVGLALAYLAVRTGSIWYGLFLHGSIALLFNVFIRLQHAAT